MTVVKQMRGVSCRRQRVSEDQVGLREGHKFWISRSSVCSNIVTSKSLFGVYPSSFVEADPSLFHDLLNFPLSCLV